MSSKKIAIFFNEIGDFPSAIAQRGNHFLKALSASGVISAHGIDLFSVHLNEIPNLAEGVSYHRVKAIGSNNRARFFLRIIDEIIIGFSLVGKTIFRKYDLFILSSPPYLSGLIAALFLASFRRAFIIDIRDYYPQTYIDLKILKESGVIVKILKKLNQFIFNRARAITCTTTGQMEHIKKDFSGTEVEVIYNGFPEHLLLMDRDKTAGFKVVFHGVLGAYQDINALIQLARELETYQIDFIVIGSGSKADDIEKAALDNLSYLGVLAHEETMAHVASCDVGVCLRDSSKQSRYTFPVKIWEYAGLNMPMIITPFCEASHFFDNEKILSFESGDVKGMKRAILNLQKEKQKQGLCQLSENPAQEFKFFTREHFAEKFSNLIMSKL